MFLGGHLEAAGGWMQEDEYIDVSPADSPPPGGGGGSGLGGNGVAPPPADMEDPVYETPPERFWSLGDLFEVPHPRHRFRQASMCDAVQPEELQERGRTQCPQCWWIWCSRRLRVSRCQLRGGSLVQKQ